MSEGKKKINKCPEGPKILLYDINPNNHSQKLSYNRLYVAAVLSCVQLIATP